MKLELQRDVSCHTDLPVNQMNKVAQYSGMEEGKEGPWIKFTLKWEANIM